MKKLFYCLVILTSPSLFAQQTINADVIEEPKYDTTSIDIRSTNSFYFCSKLYRIPRDCDKKNQSNCCSFSSQVLVGQKFPGSGDLGCNNGTSLFWYYYESEDQAKAGFEGYSPQIKKQMKKFKQTKIKLFICNQEANAYRINFTTPQGFEGNEIIAYTSINGQNVFLQLRSQKEFKTSKELQPIFQQILQF